MRPAIPDVVAEHLEEHGFLSLQRRKLTFSTDLPARRLVEHDDRIAAQWDGLVVNRPASVEHARQQLGADDPWERAGAIRFWLTFARPSLDALLEIWKETPPEHAPSWREALRNVPVDDVDALFPAARRAALPPLPMELMVDALGWHGALPAALAEASARHAEGPIRAAVARHAAYSAASEGLTMLRPLLDDAEPRVRRRAMWSLALTDREAGLERARSLARGKEPDPFAVRVLGLVGHSNDHETLAAVAATDAGRLAAFQAFADLGTPDAVESLIRLHTLPDDALRLAATEALEIAIGPIPRADSEAPATPEEARARWESISVGLRDGDRVLGGYARPWRGEPDDEPAARRWYAALTRSKSSPLRREVPDGFFDDSLATDVRPGE